MATRKAAAVIVHIRDLRKGRGDRPLILLRRLDVRAGEIVAIAGLDERAAELLVNLITGAALPDEGVVQVFGHDTREITSGGQWLSWLERFGLVSGRAALLDALTVRQNIAVPLTLDLFPVPGETIAAVGAVADECGVSGEILDRAVGEITSEMRARVRLARALAPSPSLVLLEHPWASLGSVAAATLAADIRKVSRTRGLTVLALSDDHQLNRKLADRLLTLDVSTGNLTKARLGLGWFSRGHLSS